MERYYILDKEKIKKGEFYFLGVYDTEEEIPKSEIPTIMFKAEFPPIATYQFYDEIDDKIKNKPLTKLVEEGHLKLGIGQKIVGDVIHEYEQPSKYHIWNGEEWITNIEQAKLQKREELKAIRSQKIQADIEVHGEMFQVRDSDKENFDDIKLMLDMGEIDEDYKKYWVLVDNSIKEFTAQQIIDVWKERTKRKDKIFLEFGQLSIQLQACRTIEDIETIVWE